MSLPHSIHVVSHPLVQHKLQRCATRKRPAPISAGSARDRPAAGLRRHQDLPLVNQKIETPIAAMDAPLLDGRSCDRAHPAAGLGLGRSARSDAARAPGPCRPLPRSAHAAGGRYYFKIPQDISDRDVLVCDPMLATAHSAIAAVDRLKVGAKRIKFILHPGLETGARAFAESIPTCRVRGSDRCSSTITVYCPGLGDAGDRLFRTK